MIESGHVKRIAVLVMLGVLLAALTLSGCITIQTPPVTKPATEPATTEPATEAGFKAGDRVAAPWGGGQYIGTIQDVTADSANVLYDDDKVVRPIPFTDLVLIKEATYVVDDKVMAVWSSGRFYAGTITAVDDLTLDVFEGEVLGFLGPNGAGKTTAINMMCGLLRPDAGEVLLHGAPLGADPDARARVGLCPQDIVLWDRLTCIEQLQFIGEMYDVRPSESRRRGERLLAELGLEKHGGKQARALSGGMKRRLNIAMALVHDPEIVVLDEPEAGLDPQSRVLVREYIRGLARTRTIILTTHNMDEAQRICDRVGIVDQGRMIALDSPAGLLAHGKADGSPAADLEEVFIALTGRKLRD
jgi:ABC-type multidrug transport system ATPase subunit